MRRFPVAGDWIVDALWRLDRLVPVFCFEFWHVAESGVLICVRRIDVVSRGPPMSGLWSLTKVLLTAYVLFHVAVFLFLLFVELVAV